MPRPPAERPSCEIRTAYSGTVSTSSSVERKSWMIASVVWVSGPHHSSHGGSLSLWGRWCMMSDDSR